MLKKVVQIAFLLIGGTLGLLFLPPLYELIHLSSNPWINNPYVSVAIGAILLFGLSFALAEPFIRLMKLLEDSLLKAPVGDLLFGTLGLIVGLILAFFISFALGDIPFVKDIAPVLLSILFGYVCFQVGFKKRDELLSVFTA
ncbi:MAG TPA: PIN domain nuclease, partial [Kurthia sp.]